MLKPIIILIFFIFISSNAYGEIQEPERNWTTVFSFNLFGSFDVLGGIGASVGYYLKPNIILQLELAGGGGLFSHFRYQSTSLLVKHIPFTTFPAYYRFGLGHNRIKDSNRGLLSGTQETWSYKSKALSLMLNIGIQRQSTNWSLGIDIVGVTVPVSSDFSRESFISEGAKSSLKESQERVDNISLNLCWVYIGYSF